LLRPTLDAQQVRDRRFYLIMAIASTLLVFLAFARSFYLRAYFQTPQLTPLVELHGAVFSIWIVFFVVQTALIASDRPNTHRLLGYAGGLLASGMIVLGTVVAFGAERRGFHQGGADPETNFLFSLGDMVTFAIFIAAGFLWRRRREVHQRCMLLAVVAGLLDAAPPRLPLVGGHPARMAVIGLAFLFAGPIYDLISRRRVHMTYIVGCIFALVTGPPLRLALAATPGWHHIAKRLVGFGN
jgi:hypothetical protein